MARPPALAGIGVQGRLNALRGRGDDDDDNVPPPVGGSVAEFSMSIDFSPATPATEVLWVAPFPCTVKRISAYRVGGTGAAVNALVNTSYTNSVDLSITTASTFVSANSDASVSMVAGSVLKVQLVSATGSPTEVIVQVDLSAPSSGSSSSAGDMLRAVYDPLDIYANAFDRSNHVGDYDEGEFPSPPETPPPSGGPQMGEAHMLRAVYDPGNLNGDVFNRANHVGDFDEGEFL